MSGSASRRARSTTRPGLELVSEVARVTLVPADGWYAATFHAPGIWCDLYVDIATPGGWDGTVLRAVDLDLDVIRMSPTPSRLDEAAPENAGRTGRDVRRRRGRVRRAPGRYGYPAEVVERAQASCDEVLAAVRAGLAPYDGTHQPVARPSSVG